MVAYCVEISITKRNMKVKLQAVSKPRHCCRVNDFAAFVVPSLPPSKMSPKMRFSFYVVAFLKMLVVVANVDADACASLCLSMNDLLFLPTQVNSNPWHPRLTYLLLY